MAGWSLILDASVLIYLVNPKASPRAAQCLEWFIEARAADHLFYLPALAYHEAKRGAEYIVLRDGDRTQLNALDQLTGLGRVRLLDIDKSVMDRAAKLWAQARAGGKATDAARLSGDVVIAAEAQLLRRPTAEKVVVTDNIDHIGQFVAAQRFEDIEL